MKRPNFEPLFFGTNRAILNVQGCKIENENFIC